MGQHLLLLDHVMDGILSLFERIEEPWVLLGLLLLLFFICFSFSIYFDIHGYIPRVLGEISKYNTEKNARDREGRGRKTVRNDRDYFKNTEKVRREKTKGRGQEREKEENGKPQRSCNKRVNYLEIHYANYQMWMLVIRIFSCYIIEFRMHERHTLFVQKR